MPWPDSNPTVSDALARVGSNPPASPLARLAAAVLDWLVLVIALYPVGLTAAVAFGLVVQASNPEGLDPDDIERLRPAWGVVNTTTRVLVIWLYFAWLESSPARATLGKRVMRLTVTDENGRRISFLYATIRLLFKAVCLLTCAPVLILTNTKGQMPHDQMARTLVLKSEPPPDPHPHERDEDDEPPASATPRGGNEGIIPPRDTWRG